MATVVEATPACPGLGQYLGCPFRTAAPVRICQMWSLMLLFAEGDPAPGGGLGPLPMMLVIMVLGFFFLLLPMRRQQKQQRELLSGLKPNDKVITSGGAIGVVVDVRDKKDDDIKEDEVVLRVDDSSNTRMRARKSSTVRVVCSQTAGSDSK